VYVPHAQSFLTSLRGLTGVDAPKLLQTRYVRSDYTYFILSNPCSNRTPSRSIVQTGRRKHSAWVNLVCTMYARIFVLPAEQTGGLGEAESHPNSLFPSLDMSLLRACRRSAAQGQAPGFRFVACISNVPCILLAGQTRRGVDIHVSKVGHHAPTDTPEVRNRLMHVRWRMSHSFIVPQKIVVNLRRSAEKNVDFACKIVSTLGTTHRTQHGLSAVRQKGLHAPAQ
jgi:hypothetical protein